MGGGGNPVPRSPRDTRAAPSGRLRVTSRGAPAAGTGAFAPRCLAASARELQAPGCTAAGSAGAPPVRVHVAGPPGWRPAGSAGTGPCAAGRCGAARPGPDGCSPAGSRGLRTDLRAADASGCHTFLLGAREPAAGFRAGGEQARPCYLAARVPERGHPKVDNRGRPGPTDPRREDVRRAPGRRVGPRGGCRWRPEGGCH